MIAALFHHHLPFGHDALGSVLVRGRFDRHQLAAQITLLGANAYLAAQHRDVQVCLRPVGSKVKIIRVDLDRLLLRRHGVCCGRWLRPKKSVGAERSRGQQHLDVARGMKLPRAAIDRQFIGATVVLAQPPARIAGKLDHIVRHQIIRAFARGMDPFGINDHVVFRVNVSEALVRFGKLHCQQAGDQSSLRVVRADAAFKQGEVRLITQPIGKNVQKLRRTAGGIGLR